jgi:hypothetical protein
MRGTSSDAISLSTIVRRGLVLVGFANTTDDAISARRAMDEARLILGRARHMYGKATVTGEPDIRLSRAIECLTRALGEQGMAPSTGCP